MQILVKKKVQYLCCQLKPRNKYINKTEQLWHDIKVFEKCKLLVLIKRYSNKIKRKLQFPKYVILTKKSKSFRYNSFLIHDNNNKQIEILTKIQLQETKAVLNKPIPFLFTYWMITIFLSHKTKQVIKTKLKKCQPLQLKPKGRN